MVLISPSWWVDRPATDVWAQIVEWQAFLNGTQELWPSCTSLSLSPFPSSWVFSSHPSDVFSGLVTIFFSFNILPLLLFSQILFFFSFSPFLIFIIIRLAHFSHSLLYTFSAHPVLSYHQCFLKKCAEPDSSLSCVLFSNGCHCFERLKNFCGVTLDVHHHNGKRAAGTLSPAFHSCRKAQAVFPIHDALSDSFPCQTCWRECQRIIDKLFLKWGVCCQGKVLIRMGGSIGAHYDNDGT